MLFKGDRPGLDLLFVAHLKKNCYHATYVTPKMTGFSQSLERRLQTEITYQPLKKESQFVIFWLEKASLREASMSAADDWPEREGCSAPLSRSRFKTWGQRSLWPLAVTRLDSAWVFLFVRS